MSTQLLFKTRFFVGLFTKFSILDGVHMDAYRLYNSKVFSCSSDFSTKRMKVALGVIL